MDESFEIPFTDRTKKKPTRKTIVCTLFPPSSVTDVDVDGGNDVDGTRDARGEDGKNGMVLIFTHGAMGKISSPCNTQFLQGFTSIRTLSASLSPQTESRGRGDGNGMMGAIGFNGPSHLPTRIKYALYLHRCLRPLSPRLSPNDDGDDEDDDDDDERDVVCKYMKKTWMTSGDVIFGGRSMGARVAVHATLSLCGIDLDHPSDSHNQRDAEPKVSSDAKTRPAGDDTTTTGGTTRRPLVVCLSFPLMGANASDRSPALLALPDSVAVLFVSGTRDAMTPLSALQSLRKRMRATSWLILLRGADHGGTLRRRSKSAEKSRLSSNEVEDGTGEEEEEEEGVVKLVGRLAHEWTMARREQSMDDDTRDVDDGDHGDEEGERERLVWVDERTGRIVVSSWLSSAESFMRDSDYHDRHDGNDDDHDGDGDAVESEAGLKVRSNAVKRTKLSSSSSPPVSRGTRRSSRLRREKT